MQRIGNSPRGLVENRHENISGGRLFFAQLYTKASLQHNCKTVILVGLLLELFHTRKAWSKVLFKRAFRVSETLAQRYGMPTFA